MKNQFLMLLLIIQVTFLTKSIAQNIAVNQTGNLPDTSAMLDVSSTNKGFLAPRMTTAQQNAIPLPATGLLIFNTTDNGFKVNTGTTVSPIWTALATGSTGIGLTALSAITPLSYNNTTGVFSIAQAATAANGFLSSIDWNTFNGKQTALNGTGFIKATGTTISYDNNTYLTDATGITNARSAISLTTSGTSGAATYNNTTGVLNIPAYATNAGTVTSVAALTIGTSGTDLSSSVSTNTTTPVITLNVPTASSSNRGALSSTDWSIFNGKQAAISLTNAGNSGAATFLSNTLNIPTYTLAGLGGISLTGLSATTPLSYNNTTGVFSIAPAATASNGFLSSTDWNTFNGKQTALSGTGYSKFAGSSVSYVAAIPNADLANSAITIQGTSTSLGGTVNIINGTGFVKATGATISYDNSTYLTTASAASTYEPILTSSNTTLRYLNGYKRFVAFNTDSVTEGTTNLYFTNARARSAISLTTSGTSGAASYNSSTGVLNIPAYATNAGTVTSVGLTSTDITVGGSSPITTSGTYTLTLPTVNSNVGSFNNVTVNGKGLVTAASNISYLTANQAITVTATGDATGISSSSATAPSLALTLATVNSNVGSFTNANITVNAKGLVTAVSNGTASTGWLLAGNSGITQPSVPATYGSSALGASENFLGTKDAKDLVFASNNLERMRLLNTNGYLGIGTAAPSKPIDLVQNLSGAGLVKIQNTSSSGYSSIDIWSNTTQIGNIGFSNAGAVYPSSFYFATNTTNNMVFATNNVERLRIDGSTGYMGVGSTTPSSTLEINGSLAYDLTSSSSNSTVTLDASSTVYYLTGSGSISLPSASTCTNRLYIIVNRTGSTKTISTFTNLSGSNVASINANTGIEIISNGSNWLQIR